MLDEPMMVCVRVPLPLFAKMVEGALMAGVPRSEWLRQAIAAKVLTDGKAAEAEQARQRRVAQQEAAERAIAQKRSRFLERTQSR